MNININKILFIVWLLSLTLYNSTHTFVRLFCVLYFTAYPFFLLFLVKKLFVYKRQFLLFFFSFLWFFYFIIWFVINIKNISFDLSGPNVEMFTPILFMVNVFALPIINNLRSDFIKSSVFYFINFYVLFLLIECFLRYILEPVCFLNYSCRFEAKTVGYFSTTNALATSLIVVLTSLIISKANHLRKLFFYLILFTSMARAAIISQVLNHLYYIIINSSRKLKYFLLLLILFSISSLMYLDPLGLMSDGSLLSKLDFINSAYNRVYNSSLEQLTFGYGSNFQSIVAVVGVNDWSPHLPFLKAFFYFGFIGLFLYFFSFISILYLEKKIWVVCLTYFICSLAGAPIYFPTFLVSYVILRYS